MKVYVLREYPPNSDPHIIDVYGHVEEALDDMDKNVDEKRGNYERQERTLRDDKNIKVVECGDVAWALDKFEIDPPYSNPLVETTDEYKMINAGTNYFEFLKEFPRDRNWRTANEVAEMFGEDYIPGVQTKLIDLVKRGAIEEMREGVDKIHYRITERGLRAIQETQ